MCGPAGACFHQGDADQVAVVFKPGAGPACVAALRGDPDLFGRSDVLGDRRPLQQIGGGLYCDLVVPGQVGHGLDLLIHRDRPVGPLGDNPFRGVRRPLPGSGARVERHVLDRGPPFVLVRNRREDAVNGQRRSRIRVVSPNIAERLTTFHRVPDTIPTRPSPC